MKATLEKPMLDSSISSYFYTSWIKYSLLIYFQCPWLILSGKQISRPSTPHLNPLTPWDIIHLIDDKLRLRRVETIFPKIMICIQIKMALESSLITISLCGLISFLFELHAKGQMKKTSSQLLWHICGSLRALLNIQHNNSATSEGVLQTCRKIFSYQLLMLHTWPLLSHPLISGQPSA